jgi:hypothetical protein
VMIDNNRVDVGGWAKSGGSYSIVHYRSRRGIDALCARMWLMVDTNGCAKMKISFVYFARLARVIPSAIIVLPVFLMVLITSFRYRGVCNCNIDSFSMKNVDTDKGFYR